MNCVSNTNPSIVEGFTLYHEGIWWNKDVASHILNLGKWMCVVSSLHQPLYTGGHESQVPIE
jgi:hypothetical protein